MASLMLLLVQLSGLIELNLLSLGISDLLFKLIADFCNINGGLLDVANELCDLFVVEAAILLKSKVIFFLLSSSERPLLELLLIPIHLKFELVHALVGLEDHILNVIESILLVGDSLFQFFYFILKAAALSLSDLLQVLFRLDFLVFSIN
jgi:hypothetical protein